MRRVWLGVAVLAATGCKDAFRARPEVVAEAGGQELSVDRLAQLMVGIKGVPANREAAEFIANMWVDQTLFAQAIAGGNPLTDSLTATRVLWPELAELRGTRWHDSLLARRAPLTPTTADSLYNSDDIRLLQHILVRVEPNAEPPARAAAKKKVDGLYARVKSGADFATLARQVSDDPASKSGGGYLPPARRGAYVTAFDSAGWTLAPGAMSPVVESPFGFHIIRRPAAAEVRDRMLVFVRERLGAALDSMYLDSLGMQKKLVVESDAPAAMRAAIADRDRARGSSKALATFNGGTLTVADFVKWVGALGPNWAADLGKQPDSSLTSFVKLIAQNHLLLQQADSAGIDISTDEWASLKQRYVGQIDTLKQMLDLTAGDISDPATAESARSRVAAMKIATYWDRIASGAVRPRPIPGQLAGILREGAKISMDQAALQRAVEVTGVLKAAKDSSSAASGSPTMPPGTPMIVAPPGSVPPTEGVH
ncbi:MAG: peptidylprolyl isomerase [Gemmatimonadales bacterium]